MHNEYEVIDTTKLNSHRIGLLVEALRSGDYTQGKGQLRNPGVDGEPDEFCCLGVACDVYRKHAKKGKWEGKGFLHPDEDDSSRMTPPYSVMRWFGLLDMDGDVNTDPVLRPGGYHHTTAMEMNDDGNFTFKSIANKFEQLLNA